MRAIGLFSKPPSVKANELSLQEYLPCARQVALRIDWVKVAFTAAPTHDDGG
jgi:hypothetical protein